MNPPRQQTGTYQAPPVESLQGVVERLTYHSEESGYTIARLKAPRASELVTITGNFANIQAGQTLQLQGTWKDHPKYGAQFQVTQYRETKPATITGIEKYLGSGLIKGVGPVTAKRIVAHFGLETLEIIENQIERLVEVPGIAQKRVKLIQTAWVTQKAIKEVMLFLQSHGVSTTYAVKIYKQYGDASIETVTHNPYQLAIDVYGIGFVTADAIARNLGIAPGSEFRYRSGILHVLGEASEEGHCFLPEEELVARVVKRLEVADHRPNPEQVLSLIQQMVADGELVKTAEPIDGLAQFGYYAPPFFGAEQKLAERLQQLLKQPLQVDLPRVQRWIDRFVEKTGMPLSEQQRHAVEMSASQRVLILTGGPGCGKTFTTRTIVALWKAMGKSIALASPTGRAAQRLSEMTGQEAKTVHRLLEFDPKSMKFKRDPENPIPADAIAIDEASMLDLFLANSLVKAIALNAQLLLVGDTDQLPSVGPGAVLQDLIATQHIPVVRLTEVFRQAHASQIVSNAHRINQGQLPKLEPVSNAPQSDCLWLGAPEPEHGVQSIQDLITDLIPRLDFDPANDVQVLCPMTRGEVGTRNLNTVLQRLINPPSLEKTEMIRGGMVLRVGDRVIQKVNDYNREVFNGDLGIVTAIDLDEQDVTVRFAERSVIYDYADLNEIALAWAVTIHKCVAGYGLTSIRGRGLIPVKEVTSGQHIQTGINGFHQVLDHVQTGEQAIIRVRTRNAYTIDVSAEHPLLVASKDELPHYRKAGELQPGIFACIDRTIVEGQTVNLSQIYYERTRKPQKQLGELPTTLTTDLAWALGVIVGDGSYRDERDGAIELTNQDQELIQKYKAIFAGFGLAVTIKPVRNHYRIYFSSKPFRQWLNLLGLEYTTAPFKQTPDLIFQATTEVRSAYLRGLFDTDGSVGKISVRFTSASEQLARKVQTLLLSVGVISCFHTQSPNHHKVTVSGTSIPNFQKYVGFTVERKANLLSILVEQASRKGKTNYDIIPFGKQLVQAVKTLVGNTQGKKGQGLKANGTREYYFVNEVAKGKIRLTYEHLRKLTNLADCSGKQLPAQLQKTLDTGYLYDEIVSIERLDATTMMYDLEVDGCHSFTVNGFVCHNSQGSEYPVVILPIYMQHYLMLSRNLIYTGLTRARKLAILVGPQKAIALAVRQVKAQQRYTLLDQRFDSMSNQVGNNPN